MLVDLKEQIGEDHYRNFELYCYYTGKIDFFNTVEDYFKCSNAISDDWLLMMRPLRWIATEQEIKLIREGHKIDLYDHLITSNTPIYFMPDLNYTDLDLLNGQKRFNYYKCKEMWPYIMREGITINTLGSGGHSDEIPHNVDLIPREAQANDFWEPIAPIINWTANAPTSFLNVLRHNHYFGMAIKHMNYDLTYFSDDIRDFVEPFVGLLVEGRTSLSDIFPCHYNKTVIMAGSLIIGRTETNSRQNVDLAVVYKHDGQNVHVSISFGWYSWVLDLEPFLSETLFNEPNPKINGIIL